MTVAAVTVFAFNQPTSEYVFSKKIAETEAIPVVAQPPVGDDVAKAAYKQTGRGFMAIWVAWPGRIGSWFPVFANPKASATAMELSIRPYRACLAAIEPALPSSCLSCHDRAYYAAIELTLPLGRRTRL